MQQRGVVGGADADEHAGRLPARLSGAMPACSSASQATSSSSRCCGSIADRLARRDAEELRIEAIERVEERAEPGVGLPGDRSDRGCSRRRHPSAIWAPRDRVAAARSSRQNASGLSPPGKRHPMPTIAIGSVRARSDACSRDDMSSRARSARLSGDRLIVGSVFIRDRGRVARFQDARHEIQPCRREKAPKWAGTALGRPGFLPLR